MPSPNLVLIPISGAIIGYFTNWLAIKMLFRPYTEKKLFSIKLPFTPGIIPKERKRLAQKVGQTVSTHLITKENLLTAVTSDETRKEIEKIVENVFAGIYESEDTVSVFIEKNFSIKEPVEIYNKALNALKSSTPNTGVLLKNALEKNPEFDTELKKLISKIIDENVGTLALIFINKDKVFNSIKENIFKFLDDENNKEMIVDRLDEFIKKFAQGIMETDIKEVFEKLSEENKDGLKTIIINAVMAALSKGAPYLTSCINIEKLVEEQINSFSMEEGEKIVLSVIKRELNAITILGGLLGFIIGAVTVCISYL